MEIPKSLQEEIHRVQNKLKNAIQNHQVYVGKLNENPNNEELLGQIHEIQEHIISLSKCQKQVVQRLRKEVKLYEAANSNNGTKVSIASLLGLNNNNNITNNNETETSDTKKNINSNNINMNGLSRRNSKDDYEDGIRNVDVPLPAENCPNNCAKVKTRNEANSGTDTNDEDVIEITVDDNTVEKREGNDVCQIDLVDQLDFLGSLGLITSDKHTEIQRKRAERKRRSTANPQFVYSNWEIPTKRKRHSYLQSNGTAPQTRQTTARLNGPSPPPTKVLGNKPSPPPPRAAIKSLIPTQKSSTRPNILRNNQDSKVFTDKIKTENGLSLGQTSLSSKSVQSVGNKAVHIPGLPSSLTIERIENDSSSVVCIHCRNPGLLTVCEICDASFHASCHVVSSAPLKTCPKCVTNTREQEESSALLIDFKEEDEIATTSDASGIVGKTREDSEVDKTTCGFHKDNAAEDRPVPTTVDINQLPSSTFLIPITPNPLLTSSSSSATSSSSAANGISQSENIVPTSASINRESNNSTPYSSILLNQLSKPKISRSNDQASYTYKLSVPSGVQQEKSQSYLVLKKVSDLSANTGRSKSLSASIVAGGQCDKRSSSSVFDYQQSSSIGYNDDDQSEIKSIPAASNVEYPQLPCRQYSRKFKFNGEGFKGAEDETSESIFDGESEFAKKNFNGDQGGGKLRSKLSINELRPSRRSNVFIPLHSIIDNTETLGQFDCSKQSENGGKVGKYLPVTASGKGKSKSNLLYSLFTSNNEPDTFPGCVIYSQSTSSEQIEPEYNCGSIENRESRYLVYDETGTGSRLRSSSCANIAEHVKLEEAHLPAPLRRNLVRKSVDSIDAILEKKQGEAKCENFTDTQPRNDVSNSRRNKSQLNSGKEDVGSSFTSFEDYHNENLRATLDFIAIERKQSSNYIKFHDYEECGNLQKNNSNKARRKERKELLQKNFPPLGNNQLSHHEIKAEFERQDLPINESESIKYEESITMDKRTNDTSSSHGSKTNLAINAVSTENMQVLEQFESAMLQVEEDETANC